MTKKVLPASKPKKTNTEVTKGPKGKPKLMKATTEAKIVEQYRTALANKLDWVSTLELPLVRERLADVFLNNAVLDCYTEEEIFSKAYGSDGARIYWIGWLEDLPVEVEKIAEVLSAHLYTERLYAKKDNCAEVSSVLEPHGPYAAMSSRIGELSELRVNRILLSLLRATAGGELGQAVRESYNKDKPTLSKVRFADAAGWLLRSPDREVYIPHSLKAILNSLGISGDEHLVLADRIKTGDKTEKVLEQKAVEPVQSKSIKQKQSLAWPETQSKPSTDPSDSGRNMALLKHKTKDTKYRLAVEKICGEIENRKSNGKNWHQVHMVRQCLEENIWQGLSENSLLKRVNKALRKRGIEPNRARGRAKSI